MSGDNRTTRFLARSLGVLGLALSVAVGGAAQGGEGGGRFLLGGVVRPDLPVAIWAPEGGPWRAVWGDRQFESTGNAGTFLWPADGAVRLDGPGAPPVGSLRPQPADTALVGVLPGAASALAGSPGSEALATAIERALGRPGRFVAVEPQLRDLAPEVMAALDLAVVADRAELAANPALLAWTGLGGHVLMVRVETEEETLGFGRVLAPGPSGPAPGSLASAFADIRPPAPSVPDPPEPQRVPALVAVLVFLGSVWWGAGARTRRGRLAAVAVAVACASLILAFLGDGHWATSARTTVWCVPPGGREAWVHVCHRARPRGARPARVSLPGNGFVLTRVPAGARVRVEPRGLCAGWNGEGWLGAVATRTAGEGFRLRRGGGRTFVSARLPEGIVVEPAFWVQPGAVRVLPRLRGGDAWCVEDAPRLEPRRLPEFLRELCAAFPPAPDAGALVGELRGSALEGAHYVYALPAAGAP